MPKAYGKHLMTMPEGSRYALARGYAQQPLSQHGLGQFTDPMRNAPSWANLNEAYTRQAGIPVFRDIVEGFGESNDRLKNTVFGWLGVIGYASKYGGC